MLVSKRMSSPVINVRPETPMLDALDLMRKEHIRRLPVVNKHGDLVGIVTAGDLLRASPSQVSALTMHEMTYLLSKLTIEQIMTRKVITVPEDTPLEEAARIMADNEIGGVPVMRGKEVVGIVTATNLFRIFLEVLGGRQAGIRVTASVPDMPGELAGMTKAIYDLGGNIIALGTFMGDSPTKRLITLKVENVEGEALKNALQPFVEKIVDFRVTRGV